LVGHPPVEVGYPDLLGSGTQDGYEWTATRRLPGRNLRECWADLDVSQQIRALADLWVRLEAVHRIDPTCLPALPPTPFYALDLDVARRQLRSLSTVIGPELRTRLDDMIRAGFAAMADVPQCLVHTDAGTGNTVWDGEHAIPVDFEFACLGPADLDLENIGRSLASDQPELLTAFGEQAHDLLLRPGAATRLAAYAVLRDLWALQGWVTNWPERRNVDTWGPMCNLHAHAAGTSWVNAVVLC